MGSKYGQKSYPSTGRRSGYSKRSSVSNFNMNCAIPEEEEDLLGDGAAQEILRENQLKQDRRKQDETRDRLGSIQDRISRALSKYDLADGGVKDFKLDRKQSEQAFDVYIVGFNESAIAKSKLLESLYNFFLVYEDDEVSTSPTFEVDLESSYDAASNALETANASLTRLANIHTSLMESYESKLANKENKKKTKKLEQSFKEAQNELVALKDTLETSTRSLNDANTKAEGLRRTLDMKSSELEKNKVLIEKLRKQAENSLGVDEKKIFKERTELLYILEKENTELKLHLAQLEFSTRKTSSRSVKDNRESSATDEIISGLQNKMNEEREKHEESLRMVRAGVEAEVEEALERQTEEFEMVVGDLNNKISFQDGTISDLENKLAESNRPVTQSPPTSSSPTPVPEPIETVIPVALSERTTSAVSIDPTEALNKKYKELEEEYEKKRVAVEQEMTKNDQKNQWKIEELKNELEFAKEDWEKEKEELEQKVESFRKMVAEMEAESQERTHKLSEMLAERKEDEEVEMCSVNGSVDSQENDDEEEVGIPPAVTIRPTTAFRNTLTPGPDNPVINQVVTMYDHVKEFKEKLIDILAEIQNMGVIDETETMLMRRSMEQISNLEFSREGDVHQQIEDIQNSIALVMHSSEKTVHKIFKKLSKERGKIEKLSWVSEATRPKSTRSSRRSVQLCDRATSPLNHFNKPQAQKHDSKIAMGTRRPPAQYTALFAHQDMEHNKRSLKQALLNHKITPKQYEEVVAMMSDYANIPQKRLQQLAKHYISHARMQIMEENIHMNRPVCDDVDDVLSRLDELYLLRKTRYGSDMDQLAVEREDLAYLLTKQLDRLENQSGIFLIKPYIAYKSHILTQKHKPAVFLHQSQASSDIQTDKPEPDSAVSWSVGASRTSTIHDWSPDIPKLLELDCNRITVARNVISQPTSNSNSKTIKSFVVVRPTKSNGSFRPRSNATSAEFLSISSDRNDDMSITTSDNLPPLRSACTSGFVSTSNSRQRLAPIASPPNTINIEKVATVT